MRGEPCPTEMFSLHTHPIDVVPSTVGASDGVHTPFSVPEFDVGGSPSYHVGTHRAFARPTKPG